MTTDGNYPQHTTCVPTDFLKIGEATPAAFVTALTTYLADFSSPLVLQGKRHCNHCGAQWDGMLHALGAAEAFTWGIAHGEGTCSGCGWPYRAHHRIPDPAEPKGQPLLSLQNMPLAYGPQNVTSGAQ